MAQESIPSDITKLQTLDQAIKNFKDQTDVMIKKVASVQNPPLTETDWQALKNAENQLLKQAEQVFSSENNSRYKHFKQALISARLALQQKKSELTREHIMRVVNRAFDNLRQTVSPDSFGWFGAQSFLGKNKWGIAGASAAALAGGILFAGTFPVSLGLAIAAFAITLTAAFVVPKLVQATGYLLRAIVNNPVRIGVAALVGVVAVMTGAVIPMLVTAAILGLVRLALSKSDSFKKFQQWYDKTTLLNKISVWAVGLLATASIALGFAAIPGIGVLGGGAALVATVASSVFSAVLVPVGVFLGSLASLAFSGIAAGVSLGFSAAVIAPVLALAAAGPVGWLILGVLALGALIGLAVAASKVMGSLDDKPSENAALKAVMKADQANELGIVAKKEVVVARAAASSMSTATNGLLPLNSPLPSMSVPLPASSSSSSSSGRLSEIELSSLDQITNSSTARAIKTMSDYKLSEPGEMKKFNPKSDNPNSEKIKKMEELFESELFANPERVVNEFVKDGGGSSIKEFYDFLKEYLLKDGTYKTDSQAVIEYIEKNHASEISVLSSTLPSFTELVRSPTPTSTPTLAI